MPNGKKHQRHKSHDISNTPKVTDRQRRVSFDLAHNTVHKLPSMKQIKHMIQMREKAEQEKQATNQEILDESIIDEIEKDLQACTCQDNDADSSVTSSMSPSDSMCIKSCLKKTSAIKFENEQEFMKTKGTKCSEPRKKNRSSKDFVSSNDPALVAQTISAH